MSTPPHDHLVDAIEHETAAVHRETAAIRGQIAALVPGACGRTRIGEMGEDLGAAR